MSLIVNEPNSQQEANNIRRAFKIAQNAVHKLKQSSPDLWTISQKRNRQNLRDNVRRVLLAAPGEYGEMKLEVTAWQYSVHNVITRIKKECRGSKSNQTNYNIRSFLESTHGWYSSFMFQLLDKLGDYGGAENLTFDWWSQKDGKDNEVEKANLDKSKVQHTLLTLCYKTLLCLGDICRYQNDFFPEHYSISLSYRYYMQAWNMDPVSGMPWNNIGSLMTHNFHGVFSLFFYRRCLQSDNPYVDCYKNLKHLFDKSKRNYISYPRNQMDNIPISASQSERKQAVYWFCVVFVHLNGLLRPATYCTERELNTCCRRLLDLLDLCLYFNEETTELLAELDEDQKPGFIKRSGLRIEGPNGLTNSFLVVIFAILIQSFDDLRKQNSNRIGAANALFVAAADFVVNHMITKIKDFDMGQVAGGIEEDNETEVESDEIDEEDKANITQPTKSDSKKESRKKQLFIRRRRKDEDLSEGDSEESCEDEEIIYESEEDDSVYSQDMDSDEELKTNVLSHRNINNNTNHPILEEEVEEDSDPYIEVKKDSRKLACSFMKKHDDIDEENEELCGDDKGNFRNDMEDQAVGELVFEFENDQTDKKSSEDLTKMNISLDEVSKNFENFFFLESIKLICDWLQVNDQIIQMNLKSPLWIRLSHLCNLIPIKKIILIKGEENISKDLAKVIEQDSWMQCFSLWEDRFLYGIPIMTEVHDHIDFKAAPKMSRWDENLFRLICIRKFMKHLVDKFPETEIKFENGQFLGPSIDSVKEDEFNIRGTFQSETNDEKNNEQYVLVPTPEAMAYNLESFKTIVENYKFSTIVTNITIDGLDEMKKISKEARDTTRWLDLSFSRCLGNVQSMQQSEQKSLQRLRRTDMTAWILQHLINIGSKLQRQRKTVILLVNAVDGQMSPSVRKALSSASANNLSIQTVEDFVRQTKITDL